MTLDEYNLLLDRYAPNLKCIYFSLPIGPTFQSRKIISDQFNNSYLIEKFWIMLKNTMERGISLELVLNMRGMDETNIMNTKDMLDRHDIDVDTIGMLDEYYGHVERYYPGKKYVHSFNNFIDTMEKYDGIQNDYDYYVLGRGNIRNQELFKYITHEKKSKVILIPNNGCSFNCAGCIDSRCLDIFKENLVNYSIDELYARQSIMPFEINEQYLDLSNVDYFKLSTRSKGTEEIMGCINSYVNNINEQCVYEDIKNYHYWCGLAWFTDYYGVIDYRRMIEYKIKIYQKLQFSY